MDKDHLCESGLTAYHEELQKILEQKHPDGYNLTEWTIASVEAIVKATAKMITVNNSRQ